MIDKLGIIPAAGQANRFDGILKELLPLHDCVTLLKHSLNAMMNIGVDAVLLITNRDKLATHANHLHQWRVYYAVQLEHRDLWGAICESLPIHGRMNYFAMPDTYYPVNVFENCVDHFCINWFETDQPERYGILTEQGIVDKEPLGKGTHKAWGTLAWSYKVAELWIKNINRIKNHTHAFNMAIDEFGFTLKRMEHYSDLATMSDYQELIRNV